MPGEKTEEVVEQETGVETETENDKENVKDKEVDKSSRRGECESERWKKLEEKWLSEAEVDVLAGPLISELKGLAEDEEGSAAVAARSNFLVKESWRQPTALLRQLCSGPYALGPNAASKDFEAAWAEAEKELGLDLEEVVPAFFPSKERPQATISLAPGANLLEAPLLSTKPNPIPAFAKIFRYATPVTLADVSDNGPLIVWLHRADNWEPELREELELSMAAFYGAGGRGHEDDYIIPASKLSIGCLIALSTPPTFTRAVVLSVEKEELRLRSVDYGTEMRVDKKSARYLHQSFYTSSPAQAVPVLLQGLRPEAAFRRTLGGRVRLEMSLPGLPRRRLLHPPSLLLHNASEAEARVGGGLAFRGDLLIPPLPPSKAKGKGKSEEYAGYRHLGSLLVAEGLASWEPGAREALQALQHFQDDIVAKTHAINIQT